MSDNTPWGWSTTIDLYNCDLDLITNPQIIQEYVDELVELLEMKKYGDCHIVNFGKDPKVSGYSMFQMIETSNISGHFANLSKTAYIDIFSCKYYDPKKAALYSQNKFNAKNFNINTQNRY